MSQERKTFDPSVNWQAVQPIEDHGRGVAQVCRDMSPGARAVRRRLAQCAAEQSRQAGIGEPLTAEQQRPPKFAVRLAAAERPCTSHGRQTSGPGVRKHFATTCGGGPAASVP